MAYPHLSQSQSIITNPPVPYIGSIPGGIKPGTMIYINGFVPMGAERFHVNLQCGVSKQPRSDIALHFNPRFKASVVVRNALKGQNWGAEEKGQQYFPFAYNTSFEILILVMESQYKVAVNGQHFCEFKHRVVRLQRVTHLAIEGVVQITQIRFQEGAPTPAPPPAAMPPSFAPPPYAAAGPVINPNLPYNGPIPGGMYVGRTIVINGTVNPTPDMFHIHLVCGPPGTRPKPNVAFRFNPRFQTRKIHRNTMMNQAWGGVENDTGCFPFMPNGYFEIIILCQQDVYKVAVNGQHLVEFRHRLAYQTVSYLEVNGGVRISQIKYQ